MSESTQDPSEGADLEGPADGGADGIAGVRDGGADGSADSGGLGVAVAARRWRRRRGRWWRRGSG